VPDTFNMMIDYPGGPSVVLMNTLSNATGASTLVRGTDGTLTFQEKEIVITRHDAKEPSHVVPCPSSGDTAGLWANFIDCVHSRQKPLSPVDIAARVQAPLNMAILSYQQNKVARFDREKQEIVL